MEDDADTAFPPPRVCSISHTAGAPEGARESTVPVRVDCAAIDVVYWCSESYRRRRTLGKVTCVVVAALAVLFFLPGDAFADGMTVKRHVKKPVAHTSVVRVGCPDRYSCYSLYGAYGPFGGHSYWTRYTYAGWYR